MRRDKVIPINDDFLKYTCLTYPVETVIIPITYSANLTRVI